ncbi:MAG: hypothetical protein K5888_00220 [Lachnospiraceae bacterium]|nr:hypothetical protein [Lachnospiraceae bacterium]
MSDEFLNNTENDETAALFVSAQKKKKAEEEAAQRAAEEQAKRDAAAAEVRRMEQEVEERRRKAEEEKLALEKAQKEAAEKKTQAPATPPPVNEAVKEVVKQVDKKKLPMLIGIAAGVLVVIVGAIVGIILALKGKKLDLSTVDVNEEYVSKNSEYDIKISYPEDIYPEVAEDKADNGVVITMTPKKKNGITTYFAISDLADDDGDGLTKEDIGLYEVKDIQNYFEKACTAQLESIVPDAEVTDYATSEYDDSKPINYYNEFYFADDKHKSCSSSAWIEPNSNGSYKVVQVFCLQAKGDVGTVDGMTGLLADANNGDAYGQFGANPPKSKDLNGLIEETTMRMGLKVPQDQFARWEHTTNYNVYSDVNGAKIIVEAMESGIDLSEGYSYDEDALVDLAKDQAEKGINGIFSNVESRMLVTDQSSTEGWIGYIGEYKTVIGGTTYWERYRLALWTNEKTGEIFWGLVVTLAPEANKDDYKAIFDEMLNNMVDI